MEKYPGTRSLYLALTRVSARSILWPALQEINDKYKIGCDFNESNLEMRHPNGAILTLVGADVKNFTKRLRGGKYPAVAIDEVQDLGSHVESLIDDILVPAQADYPDSWLAVTGTPGPVPKGYFYELTEEGQHGYSVHKWTILDNPHMPNPQKTIDDIKKRKGWDETNPTLLREWRNQWVLDTNSLWVRYKADLNDFKELPKEHTWNYIMGVDIGFNDADAIAVIGWNERAPTCFLREELIQTKQGITELAESLEKLIAKYDPIRIVMDTGGLGKKIAEEIRKRFSIPVIAAEKQRKFEYIELLNDALRTGRFMAQKDSAFAQDCQLVEWDRDPETQKKNPDRPAISDKYHSDICDAVLYAFRESLHWLHQPEPATISIGSPEFFQKQEALMEEAALEILRNQKENEPEPLESSWGWG